TGKITVEVSGLSNGTVRELKSVIGNGTTVNCGRPVQEPYEQPSPNTVEDDACSIWLYDLYHNSVVDGPGRRSVIRVAGCSLLCPGCYSPQTHKRENGSLVPISSIIKEIVENRSKHDGVTILGGEPFDQAAS